jgi:hypothetical protein
VPQDEESYQEDPAPALRDERLGRVTVVVVSSFTISTLGGGGAFITAHRARQRPGSPDPCPRPDGWQPPLWRQHATGSDEPLGPEDPAFALRDERLGSAAVVVILASIIVPSWTAVALSQPLIVQSRGLVLKLDLLILTGGTPPLVW